MEDTKGLPMGPMEEDPGRFVETDGIPRRFVEYAHQAIEFVRQDCERSTGIRLPDPTTRWFDYNPLATPSDGRTTDFALRVLNISPIDSQLSGKLSWDIGRGELDPIIWLKADLSPNEVVIVAAHEARHLWQTRDDSLSCHSHEDDEKDAYKYCDDRKGELLQIVKPLDGEG
jgi:hypothetical protein